MNDVKNVTINQTEIIDHLKSLAIDCGRCPDVSVISKFINRNATKTVKVLANYGEDNQGFFGKQRFSFIMYKRMLEFYTSNIVMRLQKSPLSVNRTNCSNCCIPLGNQHQQTYTVYVPKNLSYAITDFNNNWLKEVNDNGINDLNTLTLIVNLHDKDNNFIRSIMAMNVYPQSEIRSSALNFDKMGLAFNCEFIESKYIDIMSDKYLSSEIDYAVLYANERYESIG